MLFETVNCFSPLAQCPPPPGGIWADFCYQKGLYVQILESYIVLLENVLAIKEEIAVELNSRLSAKEHIIDTQNNMIDRHKSAHEEAETLNTLFMNIFSSLREAKNTKEFKEILKEYDVDYDDLPFLN